MLSRLRSVDWPLQAGLLAVGLMWLLPFLSYIHRSPIPSFYGEWVAASIGLLAMMVLLRNDAWQPFTVPRIVWLPLAVTGLILLQLGLGRLPSSQPAFLGMLYLLWAALLMVLGLYLRQRLGWERLSQMLAWCLVIGGVLSAGVTLLQYFGAQRSLAGWIMPMLSGSGYGNLGQVNHFADYMALGLASLLYLHARRMLALWWLVGLSCLFLLMLALSGSRSGWLYLLAMAVLAWFHRKSAPGLFRAAALLLPMFLVTQWLLPYLSWLADWGSMQSPTERLVEGVEGQSIRLYLWQQAWQMFSGSPWLGVGFGQFDWQSFVLTDNFASGPFVPPAEHAHNIVLHLLAELGLLGGLVLLAAGYYWIRDALRSTVSLERWWLLALLAVLGIHSLLEYPLWYSYFLGIAAFLLGAGASAVWRPSLQRVGRPALAAVLLLGGVTLVNLAQSYAMLEGWMSRGQRGLVKPLHLGELNSALLQIHRQSLFAPYVELIYASSITPDKVALIDKLRLTQSALHFSPIREAVFRHALLLALAGQNDQALQQLRRALRAYPEDGKKFIAELEALPRPNDFGYLLTEAKRQLKEQE